MYYRLSFKNNPDLVVAADKIEDAPEVARVIHEFDGKVTSEITSIVKVNTLGDLLSPSITIIPSLFPIQEGVSYRLNTGKIVTCTKIANGMAEMCSEPNKYFHCNVSVVDGKCWGSYSDSVKEKVNA